MTNILAIPQELLDIIILYVGFDDVKSLRQTCRQFSGMLRHKVTKRVEIIRADNALELKTTVRRPCDVTFQYLQVSATHQVRWHSLIDIHRMSGCTHASKNLGKHGSVRGWVIFAT